MNTFSFNSFAEVQTPNEISYLKPYTINDNVSIKATEIKEGTTKEGKPWKSLVITFGNDDGIHNDTTFFLDINDPAIVERKVVDSANGGKRLLASRWEQTYYKLAAIGHAFAPELIEKFNTIVGKCKTFDDFIKAFKAMVDKVANKNTTSMKLVGRNNDGNVYATLPSCVGIAQAKNEKTAASNGVQVGDWYTWMTSPFGSNLFFSAYEESKKAELNNAKPTNMDAISKTVDGHTGGSEDEIDFNSLL